MLLQLVVERMLASEGIKRVDLGREEFNKRVLEWKAKYVNSCSSHFTFLVKITNVEVSSYFKLVPYYLIENDADDNLIVLF